MTDTHETTGYYVEPSADGVLFHNYWGALYATPEAALIDLATVIRDQNEFIKGIKAYRCARRVIDPPRFVDTVWTLTID